MGSSMEASKKRKNKEKKATDSKAPDLQFITHKARPLAMYATLAEVIASYFNVFVISYRPKMARSYDASSRDLLRPKGFFYSKASK